MGLSNLAFPKKRNLLLGHYITSSKNDILLLDQTRYVLSGIIPLHRGNTTQPVKIDLNKKLDPKQKTIQTFNINT